jgi:hypothetical protein
MPKRISERRQKIELEFAEILRNPPPKEMVEETIMRWREKLRIGYRKRGRTRVTLRGDMLFQIYLHLCWQLGDITFRTKYKLILIHLN